MKKNLLSGAFWLSAATLICKLLGIVYLIPWLMMMGTKGDGQEAQALYNVAYLPYALFLTLGTAGFPSGIAKKIAALDHSAVKERRELFQSSLFIMEIIGLISALLMFVSAPLLSKISPVSQPEQAVIVIRTLCPSLVIIPVLSAIRGYFQGMNRLLPFSLSQVYEQLVRVVFILAGTFYFRVLTENTVLSAVIISTIASFAGGLIGIVYLVYAGKKNGLFRLRDFLLKPLSLLLEKRSLAFSVIHESLPFIYVGSAILLTQMIDQVTIKPILYSLTGLLNINETELLFTQSTTNPNKLTAFLISIVGSMAVTSLPLLSVIKSRDERLQGLADTFRFSITLVLPAAAGMMILASPMYTIFFGKDDAVTGYLSIAIATGVILSFSTILLSVLQSLDFHQQAALLVTKAIGAKVVLQFPLVYFLRGYGVHLATAISFSWLTISGYRFICQTYKIQPLFYVRNYLKRISLAAVVMSSICIPLMLLLAKKIDTSTKLGAFLLCGLIAGVGVPVFMGISFPKQIRRLKYRLNQS